MQICQQEVLDKWSAIVKICFVAGPVPGWSVQANRKPFKPTPCRKPPKPATLFDREQFSYIKYPSLPYYDRLFLLTMRYVCIS